MLGTVLMLFHFNLIGASMSAEKKANMLIHLLFNIDFPEVPERAIQEALYTLSEGGRLGEDSISQETCILCWRLVEFLKCNQLPNDVVL